MCFRPGAGLLASWATWKVSKSSEASGRLSSQSKAVWMSSVQKRLLGALGLGQEEPLGRGEGGRVEPLQVWVHGHQGVLQGPGAEAELLGRLALQHGRPSH